MVKVAKITSGHMFGEMSVLDDAPRGATVIAFVDSLLDTRQVISRFARTSLM